MTDGHEDGIGYGSGFVTTQKIDLTNVKAIGARIVKTQDCQFRFAAVSGKDDSWTSGEPFTDSYNNESVFLDVLDIEEERYIRVMAKSNIGSHVVEIELYEVWLEK